MKRGLIEVLSQSGHFAVTYAEFSEYIYQKAVISRLVVGWQDTYIVVSMGILIHLAQKCIETQSEVMFWQDTIMKETPFADLCRPNN